MSTYSEDLEQPRPKDSMVLLPSGHAFATWPSHLTDLTAEITALLEARRTITARLDNDNL